MSARDHLLHLMQHIVTRVLARTSVKLAVIFPWIAFVFGTTASALTLIVAHLPLGVPEGRDTDSDTTDEYVKEKANATVAQTSF